MTDQTPQQAEDERQKSLTSVVEEYLRRKATDIIDNARTLLEKEQASEQNMKSLQIAMDLLESLYGALKNFEDISGEHQFQDEPRKQALRDMLA